MNSYRVYSLDPGAVVEVPDDARPYKHISTEEKVRRAAERRKEARERGEAIRRAELEALFAKYGVG